ncbi:MAG: hypothetical protein J6M12_04105 [Clostridia bacterium]|nr:hypothetical protein [Clostridia bacterium]
MSEKSLSTLEFEVKTEEEQTHRIEADMKALEKSILEAMYDRVGQGALESLHKICTQFSYFSNEFLQSAKRALHALKKGYSDIDALSAQGEHLLKQAQQAAKETGEL